MIKNRLLAALVAVGFATSGLVIAAPAAATQPEFICEDYDSGKIDTTGDPATVEVTAPEGKLISGYCVKAGTEKVFVPVEPALKTVVVDHPTKDSVSHYSLVYVDEPVVEAPCITVVWYMDSWIAPRTPSWPQTEIFGTYPGECYDLDVPLPPECGVQVQVDSYLNNEITAALIAGGFLNGPNNPQESFPPNGGWDKTYKLVKNADCPPPPTVQECETYASNHFTDLTAWDFSQTRATGHYELLENGLRIWTEGATSTDKVAGYLPTNFALADFGADSIADMLDYTATTGIEPGLQAVVDFDNNGTPDGILVGESVYGNSWWLTNSAAQFVKDASPNVGGGYGSSYYGTVNEWLVSFEDARVLAIGFSLGSGVLGDGVINSLTFGCTVYTFGLPPIPEEPETLVEYGDWVTGEYDCDDTEVTETRTVTTTTYTLVDRKWEPSVEVTEEERTRALTEEEIAALECPVPTDPPVEPEEPVKPETPLAYTGAQDVSAGWLYAGGLLAAGIVLAGAGYLRRAIIK